MKWRCNRVFREHLSLSLALLYMHTEGRWFCNEIVFVCIFSTSTHFTLHFLILDLLKKFFFLSHQCQKKKFTNILQWGVSRIPIIYILYFCSAPFGSKRTLHAEGAWHTSYISTDIYQLMKRKIIFVDKKFFVQYFGHNISFSILEFCKFFLFFVLSQDIFFFITISNENSIKRWCCWLFRMRYSKFTSSDHSSKFN